SVTPISSSDKDTSEICMTKACQRYYELSESRTEDDSIMFVEDNDNDNDDNELEENENIKQYKEIGKNFDYEKETYSLNFNDKHLNSLTVVDNYINISPVIARKLLKIPHINNSYKSLSIKEVTNTLDSCEEVKDDCEIEDGIFSDDDNSEGFAFSSTSRHRHGSGATCKSHSESEMDDTLTVQRRGRGSSNLDILPLSLVRCSSYDDNCKILELAHIDECPHLSWNVRATLYVQMELCAESLRDWLDQRDNIQLVPNQTIFDKVCETDVMAIFRQVLKGVEHIHSQDLIHRDLKPQNILFDRNHSKIKIGDFGLAVCNSDIQGSYSPLLGTNEGSFGVGTTPYAAPEQRTGQIYDSKADMYSLGIILLELLHPFNTRMERAECLKNLNLGIIPEEVKEKWPSQVSFVTKLISKEPKCRPSAREILNSSLFLNKTQIIENLQKEIIELKQLLSEKNKEIMQLKKNFGKL
ncbi:eukaryotic translation initiation factor 2-alpha kinase 1-like, partial [Centruroides vittatus]|uniref:eukaryotic translation initiation factor 2-alpha kinase 1-like n=1 Tax=Centruroides vittatus TaxID=120091 RepID=UPI0035102942